MGLSDGNQTNFEKWIEIECDSVTLSTAARVIRKQYGRLGEHLACVLDEQALDLSLRSKRVREEGMDNAKG